MPTLQALFADAVQRHQSGRLDDAERVYRQILQSDARHADSLHLLGVIATQRQQFETAIKLIGEAIAINPLMPPYHANLGTSLRNMGRAAEAADSYRAALKLKADYAEAHNNLGVCLRDLGDLREAEASFRRALHIQGNHADAHNNLGNLLRETHRLTEAEASYRRALQAMPMGHPKMARYLRNLGIVLRDLGRLDDAEDCYRRALRMTPLDAELHNNLGVVLRDLGYSEDLDLWHRREVVIAPERPDGYSNRAVAQQVRGRTNLAQSLCHRALQILPDFAEAHHCLGTILLDLGQIDGARGHIETALSLSPANTVYHFNLGATKRYRPDDPQIAQLESLLPAVAGLPEDDQVHLHFALAKAYDDLGEKDRGFQHLLTGNALKRRMVAYDEAATLALFQRIRSIVTADFLRHRSSGRKPATGPIFIVGMPRSGSTLVEQILASHPSVFGAGELTLFQQALQRMVGKDGYPEAIARFAPENFSHLGAAYEAALTAEAPSAPRITDKLLRNFLYCGLINLALPNARIIHTRRDPLDTCLSVFSKLFVGQQPFAYDLAELGRYYRGYEGLMDHWRTVLPESIMLDVQYEEVVGDLEAQARRILAHCGLEWDDACLSFHRTDRPVRTASALQVRQPIYKTSVGRWRPDPALLQPLTDILG